MFLFNLTCNTFFSYKIQKYPKEEHFKGLYIPKSKSPSRTHLGLFVSFCKLSYDTDFYYWIFSQSPIGHFIPWLNFPLHLGNSLTNHQSFLYSFSLRGIFSQRNFLKKFLLLFNYSCLHFLPIPPPHPTPANPSKEFFLYWLLKRENILAVVFFFFFIVLYKNRKGHGAKLCNNACESNTIGSFVF